MIKTDRLLFRFRYKIEIVLQFLNKHLTISTYSPYSLRYHKS